jgi:hypothetical protein
LQAATVFAGLSYPGDEGFTGGVSYDEQYNWLYFNSPVTATSRLTVSSIV